GRYVVFTSGSEGERKGVILTQSNVAASVAASREFLGNTGDDAWLLVMPTFHVGGLAILWRQAD
ncbi:MAG: AMP-binding protein, partial [Actinobacteria bacterium]|nr:AMP-binding protein [Actinomycetota bacterium]NIS33692.1 AMP-binding protein [Actinomycetota bacterium]NIT97023.1 AMP-binding protein [Actinomycetota bacterium]NIU20693.1 AMP-binding protein [Actinomycetota bacterium]NIU68543.1 AMP-binding protein [Actinomycetota bacterium]